MDLRAIKSAAIIGAGVAGLAAARALREAGVACTIYERNEKLGGVWTDGYLDFGVQVQKELYEFPDFPLPADAPQFTPGPYFQSYLEDYADHFDLRGCIHFATTVLDVVPPDRGEGSWRVEFDAGDGVVDASFDLVVVCVGLYSNIPHLPEIEGRESFAGDVLHISDLKSADALSGKRVVTVGFGKSGTDAALAARRLGRSADIVVRRLHWPVPRKLAGILPFKWGLLNRLTVTAIPPYKSPTALERVVHGPGRPLVWLYWRIVELLLYVQCGLGSNFGTRPHLVPDERVEIGAFSEATMVPRPEFYKAVRRGEIGLHKGAIARFAPDGVELDDGRLLPADVVVFATGWRSDYGYLSEALRQRLGFSDDGVYLYRQVLHPDVPGLAFVGYASTVSNILCYAMQAHWLAGLVKGTHNLPDADAMRREIETLAVWKRSWMPFSHARAARLIVHLQHYLDELMTDLGLDPLRKRGIFAPLMEVIAPYQPSDYRDVFREDGT